MDLKAFNPWCGRPVQMLDIHAAVVGDAGPAFSDYSHAAASDQLRWFIDFWSVDAAPESVDYLLRHFEGFACEPPVLVHHAARRLRPGRP